MFTEYWVITGSIWITCDISGVLLLQSTQDQHQRPGVQGNCLLLWRWEYVRKETGKIKQLSSSYTLRSGHLVIK